MRSTTDLDFSAAGALGQSRRGIKAGRRMYRSGGVWLSLPALLLVGVIVIIPIGQAIYYSMTNWDGLTAQWIGPSQYVATLTQPGFLRVLDNNLLLILATPIAIVFPLIAALLLHQRLPGWRLFRSLYFFPTAISWVVIGIISVRFFASNGILNHLPTLLGLPGLNTNLLGSQYGALAAVALTFVWSQFGINTIILVTGMATLDQSLTEAAQVDGAGPLRVIYSVVLPQLSRYLQFTFMITLLMAYTAIFSLIYVMTDGGPGYGSTTLEFYVYQSAFSQDEFGQAALLGLVLLVLVGSISLIMMRVMKTRG